MHPTDLYSTHGLDTYKMVASGDTGRHYFLVLNGENFTEYLKDPLREFWHQKQRAAMNVLGNNCSSTQDQPNLTLFMCLYIGSVWIHGLELIWASWSSTSPKVAKQEG